jgi:hypothetical protein
MLVCPSLDTWFVLRTNWITINLHMLGPNGEIGESLPSLFNRLQVDQTLSQDF